MRIVLLIGLLSVLNVSYGAPLFASILPSSRSVMVYQEATAFVSMINPNNYELRGCTMVGLPSPAQGIIPGVNLLTNTPANRTIPANGVLSDVFSVTPVAALLTAELRFNYVCANSGPSTVMRGVNTLRFSSSFSPIADVVAIAGTIQNDGIVRIRDTGVFVVAVSNIGAGDNILATVQDFNDNPLPITAGICRLNTTSGNCDTPIFANSIASFAPADSFGAFGIFLKGTGIPFDPANNRAFVVFRDSGGQIRGATSVAIATNL